MSAQKVTKTTIAQKLAQFEKLVAWFDHEDFSLEEALAKYKAAESLAADIEIQLTSIKNEVTVLKQQFDSRDSWTTFLYTLYADSAVWSSSFYRRAVRANAQKPDPLYFFDLPL